MKSFSFVKMHGTGNDFLLYDAVLNPVVSELNSTAFVQATCDRQFGLGADGLMILKQTEEKTFAWDFYNCDGSRAEMCGNASRCLTAYLLKYHKKDSRTEFLTDVGLLTGSRREDGLIEVCLPQVSQQPIHESIIEKIFSFEEATLRTFCLNTGVPHAVIESEDLDNEKITKIGNFLVGHKAFDNGTNVTFYQRKGPRTIHLTTFERGVEKQTFACGTGVIAAAHVFCLNYGVKFPVLIRTPGGDLQVSLNDKKQALLAGPAVFVGEMTFHYDNSSVQQIPGLYGE